MSLLTRFREWRAERWYRKADKLIMAIGYQMCVNMGSAYHDQYEAWMGDARIAAKGYARLRFRLPKH